MLNLIAELQIKFKEICGKKIIFDIILFKFKHVVSIFRNSQLMKISAWAFLISGNINDSSQK